MADDIQKVIHEILERVVRIETKIESYNGLREKLDKCYGMTSANTDDVKEMKDNQKWLWRTIAGVLITGFIVTAIKWGGKT
jgi:hypothetical protein